MARADAQENIDRILDAAATLLQADTETSLEEIASAAGVSRATVYRHFGSRTRLVAEARTRALERADANERDALRPPGELAGGPTPLDVADVLNKVPPHLIGDQIVAEAQRLAGVTSCALYLIDVDGTRLRRQAGSAEFPADLDAPLAIGPELPREGVPALRAMIAEQLPGSVVAPMYLRGRVVGVLLAVDAPEEALLALARHSAPALALAGAYTDEFAITRRRKETSTAAELQLNLLPPRIARISGGLLAGNVLPSYDIGGDWFDYVENHDGAWLGVADSMGNGTTAAALGSVALAAFRAKRKTGATLPEAVLGMHEAIHDVSLDGAFVNAVVGRWHGPTSTFAWIRCGHQPPLVVTPDGRLGELPDAEHDALGLGAREREFAVGRRRLQPGERLLLISDGVLERRTTDGGRFGLEGVRRVVRASEPAPAPTVRELSDAILAASDDLLEDDATIVAFAPTGAQ